MTTTVIDEKEEKKPKTKDKRTLPTSHVQPTRPYNPGANVPTVEEDDGPEH